MDRDRLLTRFEAGSSYDNVNVVDYKKANINGLSTESGTNLSTVTSADKLIGHVFVSEKEAVLFFSDNKIKLWDFVFNTITSLIEDPLLNFNSTHPIHGVSKVVNGCERVVYFTDDNNPVRAINIDNLDQYFESELLIPERLNLNRFLAIANLSNITVLDSGGNLKVGSYRFAYRFVDEEGNTTNWSDFTQRVNIYEDDINSN
jgi:hypothetical protein